jgi:hypothetical protein
MRSGTPGCGRSTRPAATRASRHRYTLDLRGELSAFDGALLAEQASFALAAMRQLAAMYGGGPSGGSGSSGGFDVSALPPTLRPQLSHVTPAAAAAAAAQDGTSSAGYAGLPLLLVGHSMGGVVARAAASAAWADPALGAPLVLDVRRVRRVLATPLRRWLCALAPTRRVAPHPTPHPGTPTHTLVRPRVRVAAAHAGVAACGAPAAAAAVAGALV